LTSGIVPSEKIGARWPIESKTIYGTFFSLKKKVIRKGRKKGACYHNIFLMKIDRS
jgi:hypothetical protein